MSRAVILMYHQVDTPLSSKEQRFCIPPDRFAAQMRWLVGAGYRPVDLDAMLAHVGGQSPLAEKSFHVTFDDGFVGVLEHALPVLKTLSIPSTLFALSGRCGATNDWMHERGAPRRALLSADQLRLLADEGMAIGSHTGRHLRLPEVPPDLARSEIEGSKAALEDMLSQPVTHFAYPYGLFTPQVREMVVEAGYRCACSTRSGFNRPGEDPFLLRRIDIAGTDHPWQFRQKLRFGTNEATRLAPLAYYGSRIAARLRRS